VDAPVSEEYEKHDTDPGKLLCLDLLARLSPGQGVLRPAIPRCQSLPLLDRSDLRGRPVHVSHVSEQRRGPHLLLHILCGPPPIHRLPQLPRSGSRYLPEPDRLYHRDTQRERRSRLHVFPMADRPCISIPRPGKGSIHDPPTGHGLDRHSPVAKEPQKRRGHNDPSFLRENRRQDLQEHGIPGFPGTLPEPAGDPPLTLSIHLRPSRDRGAPGSAVSAFRSLHPIRPGGNTPPEQPRTDPSPP